MIASFRKLLDIMTPYERRRFWAIVAIAFVLSVLEVASILSILPFLRLLSKPELIETVPLLAWTYETGGFADVRSFTIWTGVAVFCVTVFGLGMKVISIWLSSRFALMRSYSISARLLRNYLGQPYTWFLSHKTSDLKTRMLTEVDKVVNEALYTAMMIIPSGFTVVLLVAALCLMQPEIAIGGAVLIGGMYGIIFLGVRRLLVRFGRTRMLANETRFRVVQEATGGLKELKIMDLENSYHIRFRGAAYQMAHAQTRMHIMGHIPRYAIEAIAFGGMILLIIVLLVRESSNIADLVPTLGLIAAVGLRLIPATQQVYQRSASLKQAEATLERTHHDIVKLPPPIIEDRRANEVLPKLHLKRVLEISNLSFSYPNAERQALSDLSLTIQANSTVGIVGGTGAGKTTFVDIILGLLAPASGSMLVDGVEITDKNRKAWQRTLGYVPQSIFLSDSTIAENIAFGRPVEDIDMSAVERAAKVAALHDFITTDLPDAYNTVVGEVGARLSGGQRQRVGIARALYHEPDTLIFDEATSSLDTLTEAAVMSAIHALAGEKTILIIAHRLSTVRDCDTILLMRKGRVVAQGAFDELVLDDEEFRRMTAAK